MAQGPSPLFQVATGETTTDMGGSKPSYIFFKLRWDKEKRGDDYVRTLVMTNKFPGSGDELDRVLRAYPEGGDVESEAMLDQGEVRRIADLFVANAEKIENGTPLAVLNLTPEKMAALEEKNVHTVEALREVPDTALPTMGQGARALRQRAIDFLSTVDREKPIADLTAKADGLAETVRVQAETIAELRKQMDAMQASQTARPARQRADA